MADDRPNSATYWDGANGEKWVADQMRLDRMLAGFGTDAMAAAAAQPGETILDVGCGAATTTQMLAHQVGPDGHVLAVDISTALINHARQTTPPDAPVTYLLADAATAALPQVQFDLLFSRFGVMFFDEPTAAFQHMRAALKAGGRVAFVCWREAGANDWVRLPMAAVRDILPPSDPVDPLAPGPFAFGDPDRLTQILTDAGFTDIHLTAFDHSMPYGEGATREEALDDAVHLSLAVGPLARALADQPAKIRESTAAAVRAMLADGPGDTSVLLGGAAWIVTARNST